jgi:hypothetical protein
MSFKPSDSENKYFALREAERRRKIRNELTRAAEELAERERTAGALGIDDPSLIERIHALGFRGETSQVFDLLPLVFLSWADGKIQHQERSMILEVLEERGVAPGTAPFILIESLLETRPSDVFMDEALGLLRDLCKARGVDSSDVIELCYRVADASGGLLGLGNKVSGKERDLIRRIAEYLGHDAQKQFASQL